MAGGISRLSRMIVPVTGLPTIVQVVVPRAFTSPGQLSPTKFVAPTIVVKSLPTKLAASLQLFAHGTKERLTRLTEDPRLARLALLPLGMMGLFSIPGGGLPSHAATAPTPTTEPVDLHADEAVRQKQLDTALKPLYPILGRKTGRLTITLETLYLYLLEHGDTHAQIIDRIFTLRRMLKMAGDRHNRVDDEEVAECLRGLPNAFTAWRYNNVQKDDAWTILIQQAKRSGSQTRKLWDEYSYYVYPNFHWGSFNIHFIYSAYTIRRALIVNDNIRHDQKNTFAILDRFAEMGWTDDEVVALVDAMTGAISDRNTAGLEFGYRDHLERSQFVLLPSVVAALGGRDPQRRPAVVATIAQMTRDTGQHFLDLGMQSIVQLAAAGKIRPDKQITITNAMAWERYVQKIFAEGMPHPLLSDAGPGNFERRFGYLREAPTDSKFWKSFHEAQKIIQLYIQSVDSPAAYTAWKKFSDIGWTADEVGDLMRAVAYLRVGWALIERHLENDHLQLLPDVVTAMGGENPKHRPAIIKAMGHFHPEHVREEKILEELKDLARFWGVPTTDKPENVEKYILRMILGIADSDYPTWRRVARAVGDNKEKMASLREGIQARAKHDDSNSATAVRALDKLPSVFKSFEL